MTAAEDIPTVMLNNEVEIPQLGFGVFQIKPEETKQATLTALEIGYRQIDTAQMYGNEAEVGEAVRESGLEREQVFVTSKLNNGYHDPQAAADAFQRSLDVMRFDFLDLFLIHWPLPTIDIDYVDTWKALEKILESGRVEAIGVSNFQPAHLQRLFDETGVVPAVNQIEVHPYFANNETREFSKQHGIAVEAWSPIAQGKVLGDETITGIAQRLGKTPAQVTLRWHIQRGDIVFPKSVTRERVVENFELWDFELTGDDMSAIDGLDKNERIGPNPEEFDYIPQD